MNYRVTLSVQGQGLYEVTHKVSQAVVNSGIIDGLATVFVRHTSASLVIQENADPAVRHDLQRWLDRAVPENDPDYTHTEEGPDDMPAHIKGAITATSVAVPILEGRLGLGTWQGIYLFEHRRARSSRTVVVQILSES